MAFSECHKSFLYWLLSKFKDSVSGFFFSFILIKLTSFLLSSVSVSLCYFWLISSWFCLLICFFNSFVRQLRPLHFLQLICIIHVAFFSLDKHHREMLCNDIFCSFYIYPSASLYGQYIWVKVLKSRADMALWPAFKEHM